MSAASSHASQPSLPSVSLAQLVARFGGDLVGDGEVTVDGLAPLDRAGARQLAFLSNPLYLAEVPNSGAAAVILSRADFDKLPSHEGRAWIIAPNPYAYFARVAQMFAQAATPVPAVGVHPSAVVDPSATVPALVDGDLSLGQSLAILDYLDAKYPGTPLIPSDIETRARVLELSMLISCDIHPVNNLRILKYLQGPMGLSVQQKDTWYAHWIAEGMAGVERLLARHGHGKWCFGDAPTLADVCLVPQIANAQRMGCDMSAYPRAMAVYAVAQTHPAFLAAAPNRQPDYSA